MLNALREYDILDCHFNLLRDDPGRTERFVAESRAAGVSGGCAFLSGSSSDGRLADDPNRDPMELRRRHPDFVLPFARVHPDDGDRAVRELRRLVADEAFVGLKLSVNNCVRDPRYMPILQAAADLKIPVLIHAFMGRRFRPERDDHAPLENDVLDVVAVAAKAPDVKIVMAHYNLGDWEYGLKAVRDVPNIYPSTSGTGVDAGSVEMGVRLCGAKRIIFGTDGVAALPAALGKVLGAKISERDRALIFGENLRRLLPEGTLNP